MTNTELNELIIAKLGVKPWCLNEPFGVRFDYRGSRYFVDINLMVEKVDSAYLVSDSDTQQLEKLLRGEQWDGTGLPPVGTECEYSLNDGRTWFRCKIEYVVGTQGVVMSCDVFEGVQYASSNDHDLKLRPLRTERDKAIDQMIKVFSSNAAPGTTHALITIYDAIVAGKIDGLGKVG